MDFLNDLAGRKAPTPTSAANVRIGSKADTSLMSAMGGQRTLELALFATTLPAQ